MALAILAEIHANRLALEAVLEDLSQQGIEEVLAVGEFASIGPWPRDTLALLERQGWCFVAAALDRAIGQASQAGPDPAAAGEPHIAASADLASPALATRPDLADAALRGADWTKTQLDGAQSAWLGTLPRERRAVDRRRQLLAGHAREDSPSRRIDVHNAPDADLRAALRHVGADILVQAGSHRLAVRAVKNGLVIDPGSVGLPCDGPDATYVVLADGEVRERRVAYDRAAFRNALADPARGGRASLVWPQALSFLEEP
ncbi:MAG: metallophosphoesterase family protein [Thermoplasmatota archaeon]